MTHDFVVVDVFSATRFGGNQLAVVTDARGLTTADMQAIAREFNFAESTFVLPPDDPRHAARVRIFTPGKEMPFAGHPTIGTACVLGMLGRGGDANAFTVVLEEGIGPVAVDVVRDGDAWSATLSLARPVERPQAAPTCDAIASVLSLAVDDVVDVHGAGVGVPFTFARLADRGAVDRATLDRAAWRTHLAGTWAPPLYFYAGEPGVDRELYARMFAPGIGIDEDPATGSAAAALVAAHVDASASRDASVALTILQGVALGRPSTIVASARKADGAIVEVRVGGATTFFARGAIG